MFLKLADLIIEVKSRYRFTFDMCSDYLYDGEKEPDFTVFATDEQIDAEREKTPEFHDAILENTCIYRNICSVILNYDAMFLHSCAISVDNKAYLFCAPSGTGKTTHTNMWLDKFKERAFVINGDKPIIRYTGDKLYVYGTPWCGKEDINRNTKVELGAIYILERGAINKVRKAPTDEALRFLISQTIRPNNIKGYDMMLENIGRILEKTPVFMLECNKDPEACEVAFGALSSSF